MTLGENDIFYHLCVRNGMKRNLVTYKKCLQLIYHKLCRCLCILTTIVSNTPLVLRKRSGSAALTSFLFLQFFCFTAFTVFFVTVFKKLQETD